MSIAKGCSIQTYRGFFFTMTCIWFVLCALLTFESVVGNESGQPYDYQEPGNYDLTDGPPDPADVLYPGQA